LTSHFLELLLVINIQDNNRRSTHSLFECKLVVKKKCTLEKGKKRCALDMIVDCTRSMCFIPAFACVSGVVYNTELGEEMNV